MAQQQQSGDGQLPQMDSDADQQQLHHQYSGRPFLFHPHSPLQPHHSSFRHLPHLHPGPGAAPTAAHRAVMASSSSSSLPAMPSFAFPPPPPPPPPLIPQGSGGQQGAEQPPYRHHQILHSPAVATTPSSSLVSLPSLNLPPIRNLDSHTPPHSIAQPLQPPSILQTPPSQHSKLPDPTIPSRAIMGSPLPPQMQQQMGQFYDPRTQPPPHMGMPHDPNQPMRYAPIPAPDSRMISGGRHKKEIKRRTKTGCLTCRKRRIKCDEGHPTCRNCMKSKRECAGYDPIFKSQPGPAAIQPAPNSAPLQPPPHVVAAYPPPPGYGPPSSQPYLPPPTTAAMASTGAPYDYTAAIDPALEAAQTSAAQPLDPNTLYNGSHEGQLGAKPVKIEELLNVGHGHPPPPIPTPTAPIAAQMKEDVKSIFTSVYSLGLDKFLETRWFSTRGLIHLLNNPLLCEKYATLLSRYGITANIDWEGNCKTQSLEAHVIWETLLLCREVSVKVNTTNDENNVIEVGEGVHHAAKRLQIFEALITNQFLDAEAVKAETEADTASAEQSGQKSALPDQLKNREREFWRLVGQYCSIREDPGRPMPSDNETQSKQSADDLLLQIRTMLDSRENRDVIYSIAIARHVGQRVAAKHALDPRSATIPLSDDPEDERNKLKVARDFITAESSGKGTTQVTQRICGMAMRSWGIAMRAWPQR